ncbi:hypothetical protein FISHEDRAFT_37737 [Fistulina hepatica ATCC 64428]|nr:hypothetical protein FISHEDRAFT_37737 [Fistulina hepatica ATCC 64428]
MEFTQYLINHFFLPPRLPQKDDSDVEARCALIGFVADSARRFFTALRRSRLGDGPNSPGVDTIAGWTRIVRMLDAMKGLHATLRIDDSILKSQLENMEYGDVISLRLQNCGIIFRAPMSGGPRTIEYFQISVPNEVVVGATGKIVVQYPTDPRISIPDDPKFFDALCYYLSEFSDIEYPGSVPLTKKAGTKQHEIRDVADTRAVSELLAGVIRAFSSNEEAAAAAQSTAYVVKRIDDHVLWHSALLPWRRSPEWLMIRVTLQTTLKDLKVEESHGYKVFMTFLLARFLEVVTPVRDTIPRDVLHVMTSKIAIRLNKLRDVISDMAPDIVQYIYQQIADTRDFLDVCWTNIRDADARHLAWTSPSIDEIERACVLPLTNSRDYLEKVRDRRTTLSQNSAAFSAESYEEKLLAKRPPLISGIDPPTDLSDINPALKFWEGFQRIERWLMDSSEMWFSRTSSNDHKVRRLESLLKKCMTAAISLKQRNPDSFSRVFLAVLEVWVLLDRAVIQSIPLLESFSPELSISGLSGLLLPKQVQLERLFHVETHIQRRYIYATHGSVFSSAIRSDSFGALYYNMDPSLQQKRTKIEHEAAIKRQEKKECLASLWDEYEELTDEARGMEHRYVTSTDRHGFAHQKHHNSCNKCVKERKAAKLKISVFEWPLPENEDAAKMVVFELLAPYSFSTWRDQTHRLIQEFSPEYSQVQRKGTTLFSLKSHANQCDNNFLNSICVPTSVVSVASYTKSFKTSHYGTIKLSRRPVESDVVKQHSLHWAFYDSSTGCWLAEILEKIEVRSACTPELVEGPYHSLAMWTLPTTTHPPNKVVALQSQCPIEITLHEWEAFGTVRAGAKLQWKNIALQLFTAQLRLSDAAVYQLIAHAAYQVEDTGESWHRKAHVDLSDCVFVRQLLDAMRFRLELIRENWMEGWTAATLVVVGSKLSEFWKGSQSALEPLLQKFQHDLREMIWTWIEDVSRILKHTSANDSAYDEMMERLIQLCVSCRATYTPYAEEAFNSDGGISTYLKCLVLLNKYLPINVDSSKLSRSVRYLLDRDVALAVDLRDFVLRIGSTNLLHNELDSTIRSLWSGFARDSRQPWRKIDTRWISCTTQTGNGHEPRYVHLDLLSGDLRIDGKPLSTLPKDIIQEPLFQTLFPGLVSSYLVIPSTMFGMAYQLRDNMNNYEVHFLLPEMQNLIVRIRHERTSETSEFIETCRFFGDIPNSFIYDHAALYHDATRHLDFIPITRASNGWHVDLIPSVRLSLDTYMLTIPSRDCGSDFRVLSPENETSKGIGRVFGALEHASADTIVVWSHSDTISPAELTARLPRYRLEFFVNSNGLWESREHPCYVVPSDQSVRTLVGMDKLRLLDAHTETSKVIIPYVRPQDMDIQRGSHNHPRIRVPSSKKLGRVREYRVYDVDNLLGRLKGDGSMESWYFLIYLHILTSSHDADPLTKQSGIQRGLQMLKSAESFAFMCFTEEMDHLLSEISKLSPRRTFYPAHLKVMESTSWNEMLSPLVQSDLLIPYVNEIFAYGRSQALLTPKSFSPPNHGSGSEPALASRAEFRSSRYICFEAYDALDCQWPRNAKSSLSSTESEPACRRSKVHEIAQAVFQWTRNVNNIAIDVWPVFKQWSTFSISPSPSIILERPTTWSHVSDAEVYFSLYHFCTTMAKKDLIYVLSFILGWLVHSRAHVDVSLLRLLVVIAVATNEARENLLFATLFPQDSENLNFSLSDGDGVDVSGIRSKIQEFKIDFEDSPEWTGSWPTNNESSYAFRQRTRRLFDAACEEQVDSLSSFFSRTVWDRMHLRWPPTYPLSSHCPSKSHIECGACEIEIQRWFLSNVRNCRLKEHTDALRHFLGSTARPSTSTERISPDLVFYPSPPVCISLQGHFVPQNAISLLRSSRAECEISSPCPIKLGRQTPFQPPVNGPESLSRVLLEDFTRSSSAFSDIYKRDFARCVDALEQQSRVSDVADTPVSLHHEHKQSGFGSSTESPRDLILAALSPKTTVENLLSRCGQWPCVAPHAIVRLLSRDLRDHLPDAWKRLMVSYVETLCAEQVKLDVSARRIGGTNWNAIDRLDWLLVQLDGGILIRPVQADIAQDMILPPTGGNAVMQLMMGEGKSSVIVPLVATTLADGERLLRVIVLKPLAAQMFHVLRQRLCVLANRRLYYLPFSRDTPLPMSSIVQIRETFESCARSGGILLCQPEHILSFRLMCIHSLFTLGENAEETKALVSTRTWLDEYSRDILDESDEILSPKYQLIYTLGTPHSLESERWQLVQETLSLLQKHLTPDVVRRLSKDLEFVTRDGDGAVSSFPRLRFLSDDCAQQILTELAKNMIYGSRLSILNMRNYSQDLQDHAYNFVTDLVDGISHARELREECGTDAYAHLLLLRGLFAYGILPYALKEKRWRVDYGTDLSRTLVAVPYRAKDSPAVRAEFGHPDMTIILTCLSYYYGGLSSKELDIAFRILFNTDNPEMRYNEWIAGGMQSLPPHMHNLRGLNLTDATKRERDIYPYMRYNKAVIDFYLSESVFPRDAREFPHKLTTNAWDIGRVKGRILTGFSGTKDNSYLLPLSVQQLDNERQRHTNAQVIEYLLQDRNREVITIDVDVYGLIDAVANQPRVNVLLDVGAQVLELDNRQLALEWLARDQRSSIEAAVYFNQEDDEPYVVTRGGRTENLISSSYQFQLQKTVVYLDECHTRGTDFKFPDGTRAVVTLGPKLTKDKLVQACMRLRKLGTTHSVVFFATNEIIRRITRSVHSASNVDSCDVLSWTMRESVSQIEESGPLWASQGFNFCARDKAWNDYSRRLSSSEDLGKTVREREAHDLEYLYGIGNRPSALPSVDILSNAEQDRIFKRCREYGFEISNKSRLLEEQEREMSHEKEVQREVQRPDPATPKPHAVDPRVWRFMENGIVDGSLPMLNDCLSMTSAGALLPESITFFKRSRLRASDDFIRTVKHSYSRGCMDNYLRIPRWVLSYTRVTGQPTFILISPYEANEIIDLVRESKAAVLGMFSARMSRMTPTLDSFDRFIVPSGRRFQRPSDDILHELNMFAGTLFFNEKKEYEAMCKMFGLLLSNVPEEWKGEVTSDGFVRSAAARIALGLGECSFDASPIPLLKKLAELRCKGQGYSLTHVGYVLHGRSVEDDEWEW